MHDEPIDENLSELRPTGRPGAVPEPAVRRLSLYLRELEGFLKQNRLTTSSKELGATLGYTDAQVRKDLAYFGNFGHPGIGYRVEELIDRIRAILGTDRPWNVLVVGAGNLGQALAAYRGFEKKGFRIVAVFDADPRKVGQGVRELPGLEILPMDRLAEVITERGIEIGILAVPAEVAGPIAADLQAAGITGILNFASTALPVSDEMPVASVELSIHLEQLTYRIRRIEGSS